MLTPRRLLWTLARILDKLVQKVYMLNLWLAEPLDRRERGGLPDRSRCERKAPMTDQKRPTEDDVRKAVKDDGVEFLFANFVDMHARPSAKLIPA